MKYLCLSMLSLMLCIICSSSEAQTFGPIKACDNLWQIAQLVQKNEQATAQQIMITIWRKNPESFYGHNINGLLKDSTLSIPSSQEFQNISANTARQEVIRQNKEWKILANQLAQKSSQEYLQLRKTTCSIEHPNELSHRLILSSSKSREQHSTQKDQTTSSNREMLIHEHSDNQIHSLQNIIHHLVEENQRLKTVIDQLFFEQFILERNHLLQTWMIDSLQEMLANKTPRDISSFPVNTSHPVNIHHLSQSLFFHSFYSTQSLPQEYNQIHLSFPPFKRFLTSMDPLILSGLGLILLILIFLWFEDREKSPPLPSNKKKNALSTERSIDSTSKNSGIEPEIESENLLSTQLDLARVYIDMDERDRAKSILRHVLQKGDSSQKEEAHILLKELQNQKN